MPKLNQQSIEQPFNSIAKVYDREFTHTQIGVLQRKRVYNYLQRYVSTYSNCSVLELNCGTGEDAIWLAKQGCSVLATDISERMVAVTKEKVLENKLETNITCQRLGIQDLEQLNSNDKYDLIFSDFGGLNCVSPKELKKISIVLQRLLKPNGRFIGVVMSRFCWWETLYFTFKGQFKKAWRRKAKEAIAAPLTLATTVDTWYYSPKEFGHLLQMEFHCQQAYPIGFMLPPSYLDNWFKNKPSLLRGLNQLEKWTPKVCARWSDHYMIVLRPKKN
ncbi:bifunctional 2-polyprenyl-6-hydroxyphenol methylase/3-demethylubiquinol 3-O-methyltransferase UbiG [Aureispira sp. CCB-QB1]|uniref:class I SAM-dependent methyltransferase n=1 Tax=Aureispira sp. CCB-QB1 TaxID=1313421 RepID=UPI000698B228|nr:class I SAM-dependent methyltransferase [Aureispira sp. CCB-QB1]